jgi:hypothetical protein
MSPSLSPEESGVTCQRDERAGGTLSMIVSRPQTCQFSRVLPYPGNLNFDWKRIVDLAARHWLPAIYASREAPEAGGLVSYGIDRPRFYRRAALFVDKILKGARPADLPIEQPTRFELVLNLKAAAALGLMVPQSLLAVPPAPRPPPRRR